MLCLGGIDSNELEGDFFVKFGLLLVCLFVVLGKIMEGLVKMVGLESGDCIIVIDGVLVQDGLVFVEKVCEFVGKLLLLQGVCGIVLIEVCVMLELVEEGESGKCIGCIKVEVLLVLEMVIVSDGLLMVVVKGVQCIWDISVMIIKMIGKMIIGQVLLKNIIGFIIIVDYVGQIVCVGLVSYFSFLVFISISLGVMNLLLILVLDGGYLLYYVLEILIGWFVFEWFGEIVQCVGLGLLMVLMFVVVFNDIV